MTESDQDLTCCPHCGSGRLVCVLGIIRVGLDGCIDCMHFWERLPQGEAYSRAGEQFPFSTPCDNCAFRGGSSERADPPSWDDLMHRLAAGGEFYCHKGVPFPAPTRAQCEGDTEPFHKDWIYPKTTKRVQIADKSVEYETYDTERMRLCRGFLNKFVPKS